MLVIVQIDYFDIIVLYFSKAYLLIVCNSINTVLPIIMGARDVSLTDTV